jgi:parallel beta-helix repeat protein
MVAPAPVAAQPIAVTCGAVLDTPGIYELQGDLECPLGVPPPTHCNEAAITITAAGVQLDGRGFTVSGNPSFAETGIGIRITATGARVRNIAVQRFAIGIDIAGGGGHQLHRVTSTRNSLAHCAGGGVGVRMTETTGNQLNASAVRNNERWGVQMISAHDNRVTASEIRENRFQPGDESGNVDLLSSDRNAVGNNDLSRGGLFGVRLRQSNGNAVTGNLVEETATPAGFGVAILVSASSDNALVANTVDRAPTAAGPGYTGIALSEGATGTVIRGNSVFHHNFNGIVLFSGATQNVIEGNRALDNTPFDGADQNAGCDANVWRGNRFDTVNQSCVD